MAAALRRAEPPLPAPPLGLPGPDPPPPPGTLPAGAAAGPEEAEAGAAESETAAAWPPAQEPGRRREPEGEEAAREPLLHPGEAAAAGGPGPCPAPAPQAARAPAGLEGACSQRPGLAGAGPGPAAGGEEEEEEECPVCTEPYDRGPARRVRLNCRHPLCRRCLGAIMEAAGEAEMGRVRCPLCRQKTPMLEWEICKLQEELLLLHHQEPAPASPRGPPPAPALAPRRPGLCGALEHHFQARFQAGRAFRVFGCLPCLRYPLCLVSGLGGLERRCRCCYLLSLAALLAAETLSLLLIFLPIVLLVLLFLILEK